jgi:hypothetical protein
MAEVLKICHWRLFREPNPSFSAITSDVNAFGRSCHRRLQMAWHVIREGDAGVSGGEGTGGKWHSPRAAQHDTAHHRGGMASHRQRVWLLDPCLWHTHLLVRKHQQRCILQLLLLEHRHQFLLRDAHPIRIRRVDNVNHRVGVLVCAREAQAEALMPSGPAGGGGRRLAHGVRWRRRRRWRRALRRRALSQ